MVFLTKPSLLCRPHRPHSLQLPFPQTHYRRSTVHERANELSRLLARPRISNHRLPLHPKPFLLLAPDRSTIPRFPRGDGPEDHAGQSLGRQSKAPDFDSAIGEGPWIWPAPAAATSTFVITRFKVLRVRQTVANTRVSARCDSHIRLEADVSSSLEGWVAATCRRGQEAQASTFTLT